MDLKIYMMQNFSKGLEALTSEARERFGASTEEVEEIYWGLFAVR